MRGPCGKCGGHSAPGPSGDQCCSVGRQRQRSVGGMDGPVGFLSAGPRGPEDLAAPRALRDRPAPAVEVCAGAPEYDFGASMGKR